MEKTIVEVAKSSQLANAWQCQKENIWKDKERKIDHSELLRLLALTKKLTILNILKGGLSTFDCNFVISSIPVKDPQIIILQLQIQEG